MWLREEGEAITLYTLEFSYTEAIMSGPWGPREKATV